MREEIQSGPPPSAFTARPSHRGELVYAERHLTVLCHRQRVAGIAAVSLGALADGAKAR